MRKNDDITHTIIPYELDLKGYGKQELIVDKGVALQVVEQSNFTVLLYQAYTAATSSKVEPNKSVLTVYNVKEKDDIPLEHSFSNDSNQTIKYLNSTVSDGMIHNWFVKYN